MREVLDEMGPVDYLVVEFPGGRMTGEGLPLLVDLVDRDVIRVLDLAFLAKGADGGVARLTVEDLRAAGREDLAVFEGASSGLIGDDDLAEAAAAIEAGSTAAVVVYENRWAAPLAVALRRGGAQLVAGGRIPVQALLASLDAVEAHA